MRIRRTTPAETTASAGPAAPDRAAPPLGAHTPESLLRIQRLAGNRAVQRIVYDKGAGTYTAGGAPLDMEPADQSPKANCHGYTYDTWADHRPFNPSQWKPTGVPQIIAKEAGGRVDSVVVQNKDTAPQTFASTPAAGNLVAIKIPALGVFAHSAEVVSATGPDFSQVTVADKQGNEGAVKQLDLMKVLQVNNNAQVDLYPTTPKTTETG